MTIADLAPVFCGPDRVQITKDGAEIFAGYWGLFVYHEDYEELQDAEVKKLGIATEIWHKDYKKLRLKAPMHPDETPHFSFSDLNLIIWRTVTI